MIHNDTLLPGGKLSAITFCSEAVFEAYPLAELKRLETGVLTKAIAGKLAETYSPDFQMEQGAMVSTMSLHVMSVEEADRTESTLRAIQFLLSRPRPQSPFWAAMLASHCEQLLEHRNAKTQS